MKNGYPKAPSGGLQQNYPSCETEQLQITKPSVLSSILGSTANLREGVTARPARYRTMSKWSLSKGSKTNYGRGSCTSEGTRTGQREKERVSDSLQGEASPVACPLQSHQVFSVLVPPCQWSSVVLSLCTCLNIYLSSPGVFGRIILKTSPVWSESHWRTSLTCYETDGLYF